MDYETLVNLQGYVKFFLILIVFVLFYSYAFSIYRRDKKGERDFEKYSKLVHDDSSVSSPLEEREQKKVIGNKEK
ncbi:CcoQ/FixQ family Cbb3-type cytochrome c oxidase assembly chaperone [Aliarcobacter cibarius]|jgi:cytochrome c oxidase cbb3-type subunit IV|uniref:CcoQ/FixQ family Cbb3-type cytochrome c oxidase assembly chaperone n=1 Tax=Aliarcobacter cibarius TaxID=255507 RepID=A0A5J6RF46_9BACT|nr:CcoQ/FixQ family Cbb3-type cytochrome c oxidase assembly chaperone [Aliarcobacter cibarius]QEZ88422.1 cytochrome c oxidase CcoNOPQ, cbb3-type, subunit IV [Aliarcobacter cibarius]QKJ26432.1 cytochrome c oxidase CcoNOPQ, cbb3-type, subunit IV [Aliarcobacter cibarius]TLT01920.1 CcoQ/FixQ family Cbb3-type cytochrome c oxidase assembly chaperone [Aliarcobacter cibarius]TLT02255.1 CcoQ/FixQ family Cbb3-type cytochrome c oxidase assembly chaperone [Aliarcobacter cibarius]TLT04686.1 CcoQ/FixQ famil